jgi:hypothetical protein
LRLRSLPKELLPRVPAFFVLFFVTLTVPISLKSSQNYRSETLHAQVPPEVLTQTSLQQKNTQTETSLLSQRMDSFSPRVRDRKMENQPVPWMRRNERNCVTQRGPEASK